MFQSLFDPESVLSLIPDFMTIFGELVFGLPGFLVGIRVLLMMFSEDEESTSQSEVRFPRSNREKRLSF